MLMMPCHLALNSRGALTGARNAISQPSESWGCSSCGCRLRLHPGDISEHPWFEHDQASANESKLLYCQYRNHRDGLPGERFRVMLYAIHEQDTRLMSQLWYCVWCGRHYEGEKHCAACNTGIYSIEGTAKQGDDICLVDDPAQCPPSDL